MCLANVIYAGGFKWAIIEPTFDCCLLAVSSQASGVPNFHGLTGGVYKARERIHRGMLIRDY